MILSEGLPRCASAACDDFACVSQSIYLFPVSGAEILSVIRGMESKNRAGNDGFSSILIKNISFQIIDLLKYLFNVCHVSHRCSDF